MCVRGVSFVYVVRGHDLCVNIDSFVYVVRGHTCMSQHRCVSFVYVVSGHTCVLGVSVLSML